MLIKVNSLCAPMGFTGAVKQVTMAEQYLLTDPTLARLLSETEHLMVEIVG